MKQLSLNDHPDFAAVIDGREDVTAALTEARKQIILPQNQCVIVVRDSSSLTETHRRAAASLGSADLQNRAFCRLGPDYYRGVGYAGEALQQFNAASFADEVGTDLHRFLDGVAQAFNGLRQMEVRAEDYQNPTAHIDFATRKPGGLPGGVTVTMAVKGGGTVIAAAPRDMLKHGWSEDADAFAWALQPGAAIDDRAAWAVANGDICIMRACDWPQTHLPGFHKSPSRRRDGDAQERVVAVMLS